LGRISFEFDGFARAAAVSLEFRCVPNSVDASRLTLQPFGQRESKVIRNLLLAALIGWSELASSALYTIEPDDYAAGAQITFQGVVLETHLIALNFVSGVYSSPFGANFASTGVRSFGSFHGGQPFVAKFSTPISYFAIDLVNDDEGLGSDIATLLAYDDDRNLINWAGYVEVPATPWPGFKTMGRRVPGSSKCGCSRASG
jgi:hypothetical protein